MYVIASIVSEKNIHIHWLCVHSNYETNEVKMLIVANLGKNIYIGVTCPVFILTQFCKFEILFK